MPEKLDLIKDQIFENIFNRAPNGIAIVGLDFRWVKVNQSLMDLLGYSDEELYHMTFLDITHKDDLDLDMIELGQLLEGKVENYQMEKRYFHKNGSIIWVLLSVSMEVDENGRPRYFITQIMDITERKQYEWQMNAISDIVSEQNEKLMDFAHIATHDMRTHIGNLNTISDFIEEENIAVKHDPNFGMLKEALRQFESTLTNLNTVRHVDFSKNNSLKSLKLFPFVSNAIYNVNAIARHEKCKISNFVDMTVNVMAIEVYLDSIFLNFLTNAIKYRSKDRACHIELSSEILEDEVIISIKDNGLGIDLESHKHQLFSYGQTFHQEKDARGIGLFITKNHIESLGGSVEVASTLNVGSTFKITLRRAK